MIFNKALMLRYFNASYVGCFFANGVSMSHFSYFCETMKYPRLGMRFRWSFSISVVKRIGRWNVFLDNLLLYLKYFLITFSCNNLKYTNSFSLKSHIIQYLNPSEVTKLQKPIIYIYCNSIQITSLIIQSCIDCFQYYKYFPRYFLW